MTPLRERRITRLLFFVWLAIAFVATWTHEPWRDEADAWLYARDVPFSGFFVGGRYSGTPLLWHALQAPFARLGVHYDFQRWLHLAIAAGAMSLFLRRAPLPLWARAAFAFSFFGLFEYAVVARSYSLTLIFLWWACSQWNTRRHTPWFFVAAGLLAQTNLPGMIMAGSLLAVGVLTPSVGGEPTRWRWFAGAVVAWLVAVAQVWPPHDGQKSMTLNIHAAVSAVQHGLFPWGPGAIQGVLGGAALGIMLATLWRQRTGFAFYMVALLGFTILFQFVHGGALRHFGFVFVSFVAASWLAIIEEEAELTAKAAPTTRLGSARHAFAVAMTVVALPWVVESRSAVVDEVHAPFSNAPALGEWIVAHKLEKERFVLAAYAVSVAPWLEGPVHYPAAAATTSYLPWNKKQFNNRGMGSGGVVQAARSYRAKFPGALVIVGSRLPNPEQSGLRLLHVEANERWLGNGEDFWLYEPLTVSATASPIDRVDDDPADATGATPEAP